MRRAWLLVAVLSSAVLGGCTQSSTSKDSSGDFQGQQKLVANTIEDLDSAGSKRDEAKVCGELLAQDLVRRLSRSASCATTVDAALKDSDDSDLKVEAVRVAGDRATARVRADKGDSDTVSTIQLVRQGGRWKISALGAPQPVRPGPDG